MNKLAIINMKAQMKITIKLDPETLHLMHRLILDKCQMIDYGIPARCGKSMLVELWEIFSKKCISYNVNPNGKDRSLSLRYHLVNEMYELLLAEINHPSLGVYECNKLDILKNKIHPLL